MAKDLKLLVLSRMYPSKIDPYLGIWVHEQVKTLVKNEGCKVAVISPRPYCPALISRLKQRWSGYFNTPLFDIVEGIPVYYPRYHRLPGKHFHGLSCYTLYYGIRALAEKMNKEFDPDILHCHAATPDGYAGLLLKRALKIPVVCTLHGADINNYPFYDSIAMNNTKHLIKNADQLLPVCKDLKDRTIKLAIPKNDPQVLYNGCDLGTFRFDESKRRAVREKLKLDGDIVALVFVGALIERKGISELMEAFIASARNDLRLHLIIVGNGPKKDFINRIVYKNNLGDRVHMVSDQQHNNIPLYMCAGDIFIMPSRSEGLPVVVIEAMACERPVITTNVSGNPEIVSDGETGILVNKGDVGALGRAITKLAGDKGLRDFMGTRGRKKVEDVFTWEKSAKQLRLIYERVLKLG